MTKNKNDAWWTPRIIEPVKGVPPYLDTLLRNNVGLAMEQLDIMSQSDKPRFVSVLAIMLRQADSYSRDAQRRIRALARRQGVAQKPNHERD